MKSERKWTIRGIDAAAEEKGEGTKTLWQLIKFLSVGLVTTGIQLALVNILFFALRGWKAPLPAMLQRIFSPAAVGEGNDNWGYVLPFFLSNFLGNLYAFLQNRRTTFRSDSPWWSFAAYLALILALVLSCTWLQGVIANVLLTSRVPVFRRFAPTIAACVCATIQTVILFPAEKYILLRERKKSAE